MMYVLSVTVKLVC